MIQRPPNWERKAKMNILFTEEDFFRLLFEFANSLGYISFFLNLYFII